MCYISVGLIISFLFFYYLIVFYLDSFIQEPLCWVQPCFTLFISYACCPRCSHEVQLSALF